MRIVICLLVSMLVMGCSCSEKSEEKVAEKALEQAIESQTGKDANIDIKKESMSIKTKDGQMTITSGKSAKLPDSFPKDIPLYKGAVLDMAMEVPKGHSLSFTTNDSVSKVSAWYLQEMMGKGWSKEAFMEMNQQTMMVLQKDDRTINVVVSPDKDQTRISLNSAKN